MKRVLIGTHGFAREIRRMQDELERLKPGTAPGTFTSHTTQGTTRRAAVKLNPQHQKTVARWA